MLPQRPWRLWSSLSVITASRSKNALRSLCFPYWKNMDSMVLTLIGKSLSTAHHLRCSWKLMICTRAHPSSGYSDFLYSLRLDLRATGFTYGLSCTLPSARSSQDGFDIGRLQHSVDWINVMNYDLYVRNCASSLPHQSAG